MPLARAVHLHRSMRSQNVSAAARDRLLARRRQLLHRYQHATALADEVTAEHEIETLDHAQDQWDARVLGHLGDVEQRQLVQVMSALQRVERGTYGTCVRCGGRIAAGRLSALPEAAMCADCASWVEHRRA